MALQPTPQVEAILKITGDWQKFTGDTTAAGIDPQPTRQDKDELFAACVTREAGKFMRSIEFDASPTLPPSQRLRSVIAGFLKYVDQNRDAWRVMYRETTGQAAFAALSENSRERVVEMTAVLLREAAKYAPEDTDFELYAVALVGSGEAIADRLATGKVELDRAVEIMTSFLWGGIRGERPE